MAAQLTCRVPALGEAWLSATLAGVLIALLVAAAVTDCRSGRLPNRLLLAGAVIGVAIQWLHPAGNAVNALAGIVVGAALLLPMYWLHALGAGDVKLMGMVGAFLGPYDAMLAVVCSLIAGGALALGMAAWRHDIGQLFRNVHAMTVGTWLNAAAGIRESVAPPRPLGSLPYGVAIAAGTVSLLLIRLGGPST